MPVNIKIPSRKANWPPKDFAKKRYVGGSREMNWWSLADESGRENPWDIIIYNFETEDAREVNYYLKEKKYVGCTKLTGSNYSFFGASPGIVYIPPASWKPASTYKKGSGRRVYSSYIANRVASILRRAAGVCPTIILSEYMLVPSDLNAVAGFIESKRIQCCIAPEMGTVGLDGVYDPDDDVLYFNREPYASYRKDVATVAHESVHAAFDALPYKSMLISTNEMLAYAAEAIIIARLFPNLVEKRLKAANSSSIPEEYDLLFFGWAMSQRLKASKSTVVILDLLRTEPKVDDPFLGIKTSLYNGLYYYARSHSIWSGKSGNNGLKR